MIGAGFSRNAEKKYPNAPEMPDWTGLIKPFFSELEPNRKYHGENPLEIFQSYQERFGRGYLDKRLMQELPWEEYRPNDLYRLLLQVNWADIFTTNYDSLIEQARDPSSSEQQSYQLVETQADLSGTERPRLIKLHGSFPAHRPFIISQSDYKGYPVTHSLFVNTVRQALIEGPLVLIGFSGDDPNFLQWHAWIKEKLSEHAQQIYLCGVFNFSKLKEDELKSKGIIPLDLYTLIRHGQQNVSNQYYLALELFFKSLIHQQSPKLFQWPLKTTDPMILLKQPASNFSTLEELTAKPDLSQMRGIDPTIALQQWLDYWDQQEKLYPGWVIFPNKLREQLHDELYSDSLHLLEKYLGETKPNLQSLSVLARICWLQHHCSDPILPQSEEKSLQEHLTLFLHDSKVFKQQGKEIQRNILQIAHFWLYHLRFMHDLVAFETLAKRLEKVSFQVEDLAFLTFEKITFLINNYKKEEALQEWKNWPQTEHLAQWQLLRTGLGYKLGQEDLAKQILDRLMRQITESGRSEKQAFIRQIEGWGLLLEDLIDQKENLLGQQLYQFDWTSLKGRLQRQRHDQSKEFEQELLDLPKEFRLKMKEFEQEYPNLPKEFQSRMVEPPTWTEVEATLVLNKTRHFHGLSDFNKKSLLDQISADLEDKFLEPIGASIEYQPIRRERFKRLESFGTNPWHEIETIKDKLAQGFPQVSKSKSKEKKFDLFSHSQGISFNSGYFTNTGLNLTQLRWAIWWIDLPYTWGLLISNINLGTKECFTALEMFGNFRVALVYLLRSGVSQVTSIYLNMTRMQVLSLEDVTWGYELTYRAVKTELAESLKKGKVNHWINQHGSLNHALEVLSRFTCRLTDSELQKLLHEALSWTGPRHREVFGFEDAYPNLLRRIIYNLSNLAVVKSLHRLLCFPILNSQEAAHQGLKFPNPIQHLFGRRVMEGVRPVQNQEWREAVHWIMEQAMEEDGNTRKVAITRLALLGQRGWLNKGQIKNFAKVIWSRVNGEGWPKNVNLFQWVSAKYGELIGHKLIPQMRKGLMQSFGNAIQINYWMEGRDLLNTFWTATKTPWSSGGGVIEQWSQEELEIVINWMVKYYQKNKNTTDPFGFSDPLQLGFKCLSFIVPLHSYELNTDLKEGLYEFYEQLKADDVITHRLLPFLSWAKVLSPAKAQEEMQKAVFFYNQENQEAVIEAIQAWLLTGEANKQKINLRNLLTLLIQTAFHGHPAVMNTGLQSVSLLIQKVSDLFALSDFEFLFLQINGLEQRTRLQDFNELQQFQLNPMPKGIPQDLILDLRYQLFELVASFRNVKLSGALKQQIDRLTEIGKHENLAEIRNLLN